MRAALLVVSTLLASAPVLGDVEYTRDVKPVLAARCYACHGALEQKADLRLDTATHMRSGGRSGPAVSPGDPEASRILSRVTATDPDERMPPEGEPLSSAEIEALRAWILAGAEAPAGEAGDAAVEEHWAFRPPERAFTPTAAVGTHPIDALLEAKRGALGTRALPPESPRLRLRRLHLDLVGLPPTRAEQAAFVADPSIEAWSRAIDALLASPRHGERWGRHFMDIWRYSDWYGLGAQLRHSQKHLWRWRDWIVESLHLDRGYDQMLGEMLAADELYPDDPARLRATGFLARNYYLFNRTTWLDTTVEHTAKALFGLTLNCAKCHDHKYDPISQRDYYRFRAFFEPHQVRLDPVPGETDLEIDGLPRVFDAHLDAPTWLHVRGNEKEPDKTRTLLPGVPAILAFAPVESREIGLPPTAYLPALRTHVLDDQLARVHRDLESRRDELETSRSRLAQALAREAEGANLGASPDGLAGESAEAGELFLIDDFGEPGPDLWKIGPGEWMHRDGALLQSRTGATRSYVRTREPHPRDFRAKLRFRTLGGDRWRSVGIAFDVIDGRDKNVYASAVRPGSKVQVAYRHPGDVYPAEGRRNGPIELDRLYELEIAVRDKLVEVRLDGAHQVSYRLPVPREKGRLDVLAFDAVVELHALEVRSLAEHETLTLPATERERRPTANAARLAVEAAEDAITAGAARIESLRASHEADRARHGLDGATDVSALIARAARAARDHEIAAARATLAAREAALAALPPTDEGRDKAAKARDQARDHLKKVESAPAGATTYDSLRASLKALEGPGESASSRHQPYPPSSSGRRSALVRWLTDPRHPLTSRVVVNHVWLRHFGRALVEDTTDFGRRSREPLHRDLLDWLAVELVESGWSLKHLHRLIVSSEAYQLSGSTPLADEATRASDPENTTYWHRPPTRMESESIRDSLLWLAGELDGALGGPPLDPAARDTHGRRSLYFRRSRDEQHEFLEMFDDPDILACYRRTESIVPQQALALANSELSLRLSRRIADRLAVGLGGAGTRDEGGPGRLAFVEALFETVLCRAPTDEEREVTVSALRELRALAEASGAPDAAARARGILVHALVNHNDFITIR